tara:strand:- start:2691 stop:2948 length:258 start_codon:yes stop_codon:yes gene_type:complete
MLKIIKFEIGDLALMRIPHVKWSDDQDDYMYGVVVQVENVKTFPIGLKNRVVLHCVNGNKYTRRTDKLILVESANKKPLDKKVQA